MDGSNKAGSGKSANGSKHGLVAAIAVLVAAIAVAAVAYGVLAPGASTNANLRGDDAAQSEAVKAPDFTAVDAEGSEVALSSLLGKPVVLNFWASTCGPCKGEMPGFQSAYEQWGDRVSFVMVDIPGFNGETVDKAKAFLAENGYTFPVLFDVDGMASQRYGLSSIPRTFFLDADGSVVAQGSGALSEQALEEGLSMIA